MSIIKRIEKVQDFIIKKNIDFLILEDAISLLYLTNMHFSMGRLVIAQKKVCLFVDGRYIDAAKKRVSCEVQLFDDQLFSKFLLTKEGLIKVAIDENSSYRTYKKFKDLLKSLSRSPHQFELLAIENPLKHLRAIKTQDEIASLKKAAKLNWFGFEYIKSILKEGITEKELSSEYEIFCKRHGADRLAFDPLICFGPNSAEPHHQSDDTKLKKNDIVLIDIGVVCNNYHSDMTRVHFFGKPDTFLENLYILTKNAQKEALKICKPKVRVADLDLCVRNFFEKEGFLKYFLHPLGHGVGLEVHEYPRLKFDGDDKDIILEENMVMTIEPGLYVLGVGGVRYEDTIIITKDGYENFYPF